MNPNCSKAVEKVILTAMEKSPANRYPSAMSFYYAFEQARSSVCTPVNNEDLDIRALIFGFSQQTRSTATTLLGKVFGPPGNLEAIPLDNNSFTGQPIFKNPPATGMNVRGRIPYFYCRSGLFAGQRLQIPMGEISIGRGTQSQLRLSEPTVSRRHATLIRTQRGVYIRDDQSSFGTYVNGMRIYNPIQLKLGDIVQIGSQQVFEFTKG
jgi:hypothetical protein